jgi:hypothetical protein
MPRQVMRMSLAFEASQKLDLPVQCHAERLSGLSAARGTGPWSTPGFPATHQDQTRALPLSRHQLAGVSTAGETRRITSN